MVDAGDGVEVDGGEAVVGEDLGAGVGEVDDGDFFWYKNCWGCRE